MTVKELIKLLSMVEDKNKEVFVWDDGITLPVESVDMCLTDRVDLNTERIEE